jgi:hypothetical protein
LTRSDADIQLDGATLRALPSTGGILVFRVQPEPEAAAVRVSVFARAEQAPRVEAHADVRAQEARNVQGGVLHVNAALLAGFFAAGASNRGFALSGTGGVLLPTDRMGWSKALVLTGELSLGVREASLNKADPALGNVGSVVLGMPVDVGVRARIASFGQVQLAMGLLGGLMPFWNHLSAEAFPRFSQGGLGFNLGGYVQGSYALSHFELLVEARGEYAPAYTNLTRAQLGGFLLTAGGRFGS